MKFSNYIWALYLLTFPFYIFPAHYPQLADIFGAILIITNFKLIILNIKANVFTKYLYIFVMYTILINAIWMFLAEDILILRSSVYYLYSFFMILFLYSKIKEDSFLLFTFKALVLTAVIQIGLYPLIVDQGERTQLFFSNPNQLALYGLCMLIISNIIAECIKIKLIYVLFVSGIFTMLIIISASRSAAVGVILFWLFFFVKSRKHVLVLATAILITIAAISITGKFDPNKFTTINYVFERLTVQNNTYNQGLDGRGFNRIIEFPQYLLFGAGEGKYARFGSRIELHSTFYSILFCYGIIGLGLFMIAIFTLFKGFNKQVIILFLVLALFAQVHMALRLPIFWITLLFLNHLASYKTIIINTTIKELK